jgi:hypothetical protein
MHALVAIVALVSNASFVSLASPSPHDTVYTAAPTFRGAAAPGAEIVVQVDGAPKAFARADEEGQWEAAVPFSEPLSDGPHTVLAVAPDAQSDLVRFVARGGAENAGCGCTVSPSLLTVAFGLWVIRRRRTPEPR